MYFEHDIRTAFKQYTYVRYGTLLGFGNARAATIYRSEFANTVHNACLFAAAAGATKPHGVINYPDALTAVSASILPLPSVRTAVSLPLWWSVELRKDVLHDIGGISTDYDFSRCVSRCTATQRGNLMNYQAAGVIQ